MTQLEIQDLRPGVVEIAFNRPEALNAFTPEMLETLTREARRISADNAIRAVVLRGRGRAFSAGVDLKAIRDIQPMAGRLAGAFDGAAGEAAAAIRACPKPVIAAVHGFCFTGALELALHCDFIYTTETTKFGDTHVKWGLRPTWGMSQNLARAVGVRRARELSFTGRTFSGRNAAAWGLAAEAAPSEAALFALVEERAALIAEASPGAVSAYKALYGVHERNLDLEAALAAEIGAEFPDIADTAERLAGFGS